MPETTREQRRAQRRRRQQRDEQVNRETEQASQGGGHAVEEIVFGDEMVVGQRSTKKHPKHRSSNHAVEEIVFEDEEIVVKQADLTPSPEQNHSIPLDKPIVNLSKWKKLINLKPSSAINQKLEERQKANLQTVPYGSWKVQSIEEAHGKINLDYYAINISKLPIIDGKQITAKELLDHVRLNINSFVDEDLAHFEPYDEQEVATWRSAKPLGAVIGIDMKKFGVNVDDGSVIVSDFSDTDWTFTTIQAPDDFQHPVSGNRKFGFTTKADGSYEFYTQGADRATGLLDWAGGNKYVDMVFSSGDALWQSFQVCIVSFVNKHQGVATTGETTSKRHDWDTVKKHYWQYGATGEW